MKSISLILISIMLYSLGVFAQGYHIDSMLVEMKVKDSGEVDIAEHLYVNFEEEKRGIIRSIPFDYSIDGKRYEIKFENINVYNEKIKTTTENGYTNIRIGEENKYISGPKHYIISYTVVGPFMRLDNFDEFYWNITGNEWDTEIGKARFSIAFPSDIDIRYNDVKIYTGPTGTQGKDAFFKIQSGNISGFVSEPIPPGSGLTIAAKLPLGFVKNSAIFSQYKLEKPSTQYPWWYTLLPGGILMAILGWWRGLKNIYGEEQIVPMTYPPNNFSPAEVGAFIDDVVHDRDIFSLLPFWANLGFIKIHRLSKEDIQFEKVKEIENRPQYEIDFFNAIFERTTVVGLSEIKEDMYQNISEVRSAIMKDLNNQELYDAKYAFWFRSWRIIALGLGILLLGIFFIIKGYVLMGILMGVAGIMCFVLRAFKGPASSRGFAIRQKLKGLEAHLKSEDQQVLKGLLRSDAQYFERIYPYAFALGLDRSWLNKTEQYDHSVPMWYTVHDQSTHSIHGLSEVFTPKTLRSAFIKYPTSSSSSGGYSSGSSGGGFGGGGGSSW